MRYILFLLLFSNILFGLENVSLSKLLIQFQGNEYNILLAPKQIVVPGRYHKTRKAINKGYKRAVAEIIRIVRMKNLHLNLKSFSPNGSNLPQYIKEDEQTYKILKDMLEAQVKFRESLKDEFQQATSTPKKSESSHVSADDIDVDLDDNAFDITDDKADSGEMKNISPAEIFTTAFVELSELYNQEVLQLSKALHPFNVKGKPKMKPVHSVFGMAFFPTKDGAVKKMRIYIVLCNINTESAQSVQIIAKEVPEFRWDRNYLYISGATGKMLRQIISGVLGQPVE